MFGFKNWGLYFRLLKLLYYELELVAKDNEFNGKR